MFHWALFGETQKLLKNSFPELGRAYIEAHYCQRNEQCNGLLEVNVAPGMVWYIPGCVTSQH